MIEMLGVLAIIGVLSVGGIAGYSKAMMKFKTNKTIDQIAMTVTTIRTLYAQQKNYKGLDTSNAYAMGITDDAMGKSGTLTNAFGGGVHISYDKSGAIGETEDAGAFIVTFGGLPREACVAIATNDWGSGYSSGLLGIGTGVKAPAAAPSVPAGGGQQSSILNLLFSDAYAGTTPTPTKDADAVNITCDVNGGATGGNAGDDLKQFACAVNNVSAALSVAKAAAGCECGSSNTCFVTFKYY